MGKKEELLLEKHGCVLESKKQFLDKEVRAIRRSGSFPHHTAITKSFVMFYFTMLGSHIDLYFWNRLPEYFASAREAY